HGERRPATAVTDRDAAAPAPATPGATGRVAYVPAATSPESPRPPTPAGAPHPGAAAVVRLRADTDDERSQPFAMWRERLEHPRARTSEPHATAWPDAPPSWRDDVLDWARQLLAGGDPEPLAIPPIDTIALRCEL